MNLASLSENQLKDVVLGFSTVGKEVGMIISKNKADILMIAASMREAEENAGTWKQS